MAIDKTALAVTVIGALNWLLVGLFSFDAVAFVCGGSATIVARIIYTAVGICGLWCITLLFRRIKPIADSE